ncbi:MAG: hypothetical protein GY787_07960 [Alteromonadales bacterium]|nr:hypothetical protein [Alteromonadales bacterium]
MERLTTEDFKKVFDNIEVDGFSYDHLNQRMDLPYGGWNIDDSSIWNNPSWTCLFYPLLLQAVLEGFQSQKDQRLIVRCNHKNTDKWFYRYTTENGNYNESENFDNVIETKVQAIRHMLCKL